MSTKNQNHMRYGMTQTEFFVILGHILLFHPTHIPKNQNFEKIKKMPGYIIILNKCTKNHDHMLYCSSGMVRDRCNCYFSFWAIFCPFAPLNTVYKWKTCWVKNIFAAKSIHHQWKAVDPPFIDNPCPIWITHPHFYKKLLAPSPFYVFFFQKSQLPYK